MIALPLFGDPPIYLYRLPELSSARVVGVMRGRLGRSHRETLLRKFGFAVPELYGPGTGHQFPGIIEPVIVVPGGADLQGFVDFGIMNWLRHIWRTQSGRRKYRHESDRNRGAIGPPDYFVSVTKSYAVLGGDGRCGRDVADIAEVAL